jgi:hypothetical protein
LESQLPPRAVDHTPLDSVETESVRGREIEKEMESRDKVGPFFVPFLF